LIFKPECQSRKAIVKLLDQLIISFYCYGIFVGSHDRKLTINLDSVSENSLIICYGNILRLRIYVLFFLEFIQLWMMRKCLTEE